MPNNGTAELIKLCAYAGERFDLSQAGGGNVSTIGPDGDMWITASGWALSDVKDKSALCRLDHGGLVAIMRELSHGDGKSTAELDRLAGKRVLALRKTPQVRPSIETLMHSLLGPVTLHTHPIAVNAVVCRRDWREIMARLFPEAILVGYETPGVTLALALMKEMTARKTEGSPCSLVFLENHGIIVSGRSAEEVMNATDRTLDVLARETGLDLSRYRLCNKLTRLMKRVSRERGGSEVGGSAAGGERGGGGETGGSENQTGDEHLVSYLSEDAVLARLLKENVDFILARPCYPDQLVYCGKAGLALDSLDDPAPIASYREIHGHLPKVIAYDDNLLIVERSMKSCKRLEEVLKAHALILTNGEKNAVEYLDEAEQNYLLNWEAEKARQAISE